MLIFLSCETNSWKISTIKTIHHPMNNRVNHRLTIHELSNHSARSTTVYQNIIANHHFCWLHKGRGILQLSCPGTLAWLALCGARLRLVRVYARLKNMKVSWDMLGLSFPTEWKDKMCVPNNESKVFYVTVLPYPLVN